MKKETKSYWECRKELIQYNYKKLKINWVEDIDSLEGFRIKHAKIPLVAFGRVFLDISI